MGEAEAKIGEKEKALRIGYITFYTKFFHAHRLLSTGHVT